MRLRSCDVGVVNKDSWSTFISEHPHGNVFQTPEMFEVCSRTRDFVPLFVAAVDTEDNLLGVMLSVIQRGFGGPLAKLSARSITWGGPLAVPSLSQDSRAEIIDYILKKHVLAVRRTALYTEIFNLWDISQYRDQLAMNGYDYDDHLDVVIDLKKPESELWKMLHRSKKRRIRQAETLGVCITEKRSEDSVLGIWECIRETLRRAGVATAGYTFFESMKEVLVPKGMAWFLEYKFDDRIVGGSIWLAYKGMVYYFYAGASETGRLTHASELGVWYAIRKAQSLGFEVLNLSGAGKPSERIGYAEFKKEFGGQITNYGLFKRVLHRYSYAVARNANRVLSKFI